MSLRPRHPSSGVARALLARSSPATPLQTSGPPASQQAPLTRHGGYRSLAGARTTHRASPLRAPIQPEQASSFPQVAVTEGVPEGIPLHDGVGIDGPLGLSRII